MVYKGGDYAKKSKINEHKSIGGSSPKYSNCYAVHKQCYGQGSRQQTQKGVKEAI